VIEVGTVAVYLKSESGDSYLYCFENTTLIDIAASLREDLEWFCPLCEWKTAGNDKSFVEKVENVMSQIYEESWERNDD
jgi:hypothetical protein